MKNRNKVILSSAAMLAIAGASLGTGAVAWFTGTRVGTSTTSDVTVQSRDANLSIVAAEGATSGKTTANTGTGDKTLLFSGANVGVQTGEHAYATDISGEGTLIKPNWDAVTSDVVNSFATASANGDYIDFKLVFTQTNSLTADQYLYFGSGSSCTTTDAGGDTSDAAKAVRVGIFDSTGATLKLYWEPSGEGDNKYVAADATDGAAYKGCSGYSEKTVTYASTATSYLKGTPANHTVNGDGKVVKATNGSPVLGTVPSGSTGLTLTVRIWLEGTDPDCINSGENTNISDDVFSTALQFYILSSQTFAA